MDPKQLLNDNAFKEQLANAKSYDEVIELFKAKGIEVTEEMLKAAEAESASDGELNEAALEGVAGGASWKDWLKYLWPPRPRLPHGGRWPWLVI